MNRVVFGNEATGGFDYAALSDEAASIARNAATQIKRNGRLIGEAIFAIGKELQRVKDALGHGPFGSWLRGEFGWDERTAQRYIGAHKRLGPKSDTVSYLPPTTIYALSSGTISDRLRDAVIEEIEAGNRLPPCEIKARIASERKERKQAQEESKLTTSQRRSKERRDREREAYAAKFRALRETQTTAAADAARMVIETVGDNLPELAGLLANADLHQFKDAIVAAARPAWGAHD